ncbi:hypothetical protein K437DRAFT_152808 [Tilletiaria anomala UBC 951]|uniref:Major facilitator superfamily (MFS) profile domain-containing protein n=1 Tax=Tilletiaria anomala (strain ATCC 24038 / CBS 436.72 / UBC 951) TaxID=1037660 RepID=A0A066VXA2_TILAU|nr:uncharacterized protein K437DRAFT_152808 [Tilletiaria anomala UBC 951]KDN43439.1 hypothetical protein K437DRAFT_152808 [Tilletiaria anomala UBC 951]
MSVLLSPFRFALNKSIQAAFNLEKQRGARSTLPPRPAGNGATVMGALTPSDDAFNDLKSSTGFHPQYTVRLRHPRTSLEAQKLYNHIRTIAWYLDAIPFFGRRLPFGINIGVDSIIGIIPVIGDYFGLILGLYQIFLISLFGVPLSLLALLVLNVVFDTLLGLVPVFGDALDVAFESNLRNLNAFEDHMCKNRGQCRYGTFSLSFPPSGSFLPAPGEPRVSEAFIASSSASSPSITNRATQRHTAGERARETMRVGDRLGDFGPSIDVAPLALPASLTAEVGVREGGAAMQASDQPLGEIITDGSGSSAGAGLESAPGRERKVGAEAVEGYRIGDAEHADHVNAALVERVARTQRRAYSSSQMLSDDSESLHSSDSEVSDSTADLATYTRGTIGMAPSTMTGRPLSVLDADWILQPSYHRDYYGGRGSHDYGLAYENESSISAPLLGHPALAHDREVTLPRPQVANSAHTHSDDGLLSAPPDSVSQAHEDDITMSSARMRDQGRSARRWSAATESRRSMQSEGEFAEFGHSVMGGTAAAKKRKRRMFFVVYASIFCICFFTSLEANTSYLYFNFGLSEFGALASFSTVAIAQQMVFAVAKPPIAKMSDVFGRAEAYSFSVALYALGYVIVASSDGIKMFIGGIVIQSAGTTGLQVLQSIIIADTTTPQYRGLVLGIINVPYLINFAIAGPLVDIVMRKASWRWGFWLWTFVIPLASMPLLVTLAVGQRRARKHAIERALERGRSLNKGRAATFRFKFRRLFAELDFLGLLLFAVGWLLVLLPLTLRDRFSTAAAAYIAFGGATLLVLFLYWETNAAIPIIPFRVLSNKPVIYVCVSSGHLLRGPKSARLTQCFDFTYSWQLIGLLDFASFTLSWTYLSAFIQILRSWEQTRTAYFATTQNITSTLMGILVGYLMSATRRYRTLMVGGVCVRLLGVAMMVRYRNAHDPTFMLILCQLLQGVGGGAIAITMQVACQICVRHSDVALVTAFELLTTEIGAAMGSAAAGLIVSGYLPHLLQIHLPKMSPAEVHEIYGSLQVALSYPLGSEVRTGIIDAWVDVMRTICISATVILLPAFFLALAMPNAMLPDHSDSHGHGYSHSQSHSFAHARGGTTSGISNIASECPGSPSTKGPPRRATRSFPSLTET